MNLEIGDVLLTYKEAPSWNLVQQFFDSRIEVKSYKQYGWLCNFPQCNHVRIFWGTDNWNKKWVFEYTFPVARFVELQDWMVNPDYCRIYRLKEYYGIFEMDKLQSLCMLSSGSIYDIGQLFDMWLGWGTFFDFGRTNRVCSTGARWLLEESSGLNLFPEVKLSKTLPCAFANSPEFEWVNEKEAMLFRVKPEPKFERITIK